ncbi:MAG: Holliday junction DNA helicase RuvA [Candidatus Moranbacteria bacterium GW2011_GWC1_45_18]|nr:MAG: Holliday junction DNA helicase RuvA [Candidatus Moranbacteria bacterium GW2011_GWC2_40_12]KKT32491.1 MAG: Holliday junction DNA helicase RuvA [Candidatus Moranbacteria bacterium GW2011_GWF2_44_10]KKT71928.1 MAG: Holliday junction DNA helicase RuvA [Candidatus Moranbacteria bacterium GW2011_GWF1_44_4]KKU00841.1 MAG: Holliday junction DNA helicase RuvA [Candidatus Moranbacteria bacterium GW2011_GWC1_45_18]OGI24115.1 MAG: Holliday junction DNA helicase RuvA [Candidatus Moranbacteria bacter
MIAKITGKIAFFRDNYVVVDVSGVGYKIFVTDFTMGKIAGKKEIELYTHTYVREDTLSLYGFLIPDELEMFELLISISGIGPKAAVGILSIAEPKTIRAAVISGDSSILTRVSGVGKKTAERVILELKNRIAELPGEDQREAKADSEAIEALVSLGYSVSQAREALKSVPKDEKDMSGRIKAALKNLGK